VEPAELGDVGGVRLQVEVRRRGDDELDGLAGDLLHPPRIAQPEFMAGRDFPNGPLDRREGNRILGQPWDRILRERSAGESREMLRDEGF